ncbi:MAG TPA: superoxide dismutase family protein [Xanthobacteraceae bacterium]|jgi:Cu-Zn family superoxide dismutase
MKMITHFAMASAVLLLAASLPAASQTSETAKAQLKDSQGKQVGTADLTQTPAGVLIKLSLNGLPAGEHAFHIHAVGKCEPPSFETAGGHFNPGHTHHGIMAGPGHAGDMPNLYVPAGGTLTIEVLNDKVTLDKGKPNSVFDSDGSALVIHAGVDDYKSDPAGNAGARIACGVIATGS